MQDIFNIIVHSKLTALTLVYLSAMFDTIYHDIFYKVYIDILRFLAHPSMV